MLVLSFSFLFSVILFDNLQAFMAIVGFCFGLAIIVFLVITLLWAWCHFCEEIQVQSSAENVNVYYPTIIFCSYIRSSNFSMLLRLFFFSCMLILYTWFWIAVAVTVMLWSSRPNTAILWLMQSAITVWCGCHCSNRDVAADHVMWSAFWNPDYMPLPSSPYVIMCGLGFENKKERVTYTILS